LREIIKRLKAAIGSDSPVFLHGWLLQIRHITMEEEPAYLQITLEWRVSEDDVWGTE
jgi:hypothetical protein